ncbi:MAG: hypothetical protein M3Q06_08115, partial [Bacteroidota bacterium]|nr:hypothetical protein [Bacteroidota bacterium]
MILRILQYQHCAVRLHFSAAWERCLIFIFSSLISFSSVAQQDNSYEEIAVMLNVPRVGSTEVGAF